MAGRMSKAQGKNQSARTQAKPASHLASQPASIFFSFLYKERETFDFSTTKKIY